MTTFKSLRTQAQAALNTHRDDATTRDILELILDLTRACSDLQRQVKSLELEVRDLRRKQ